MKRALSILLAVVFLLTALPLGAISVSAATYGNYTYIVSDGEVTITDCSTSVSGALTIPSTIAGYPVTTIGDSAFEDCTSLTSVTIPDSVTSIGDEAFYYCTSLTSVTIPDSVTTIGNYAFSVCYRLTSVTIPDSVTTIGDEAFYYCISLTSIDVAQDNTSYCSLDGVLYSKDKTILMQCPGGKSGAYTIPDSVTTIGEDAFSYCCSLTSVTIPDSVTTIGYEAFAYCDSLTSVTMGDSVTDIGDYAFYECTNLTSVTIPDSVTSIGDEAFYYCNRLTSVTIPDSVTTIGDEAFRDCASLTSIDVAQDNTSYCSLDGVLYSKDKTILMQCPGGKSGAYTIPDSVTSIGDSAFYHCHRLTSVTIPDSVITIGVHAFSLCYSLTSVTIGDSVTTIGGWAFYSCDSLTSVSIPDSVTTIGEDAFRYCPSLTSVTIGDSVTTIGKYAFVHCSALTSVTIPDSVTSIGDSAFYHCNRLTSVTIPDSVTTIGDEAFYCCDSLTDVYYIGTETDRDAIIVEDKNEALLNATWHYFSGPYDAICNECGEERELSIPTKFGGNSISEDVSGLAFRFDVKAEGMSADGTTAVYDNATVGGYKLLSMGAIVSNDISSKDIAAVYLCDLESDSAGYAIRITNIPAGKYDVPITATPYIVLEIDGVATTIYGEAQTCSYNDVKN